ncbi:MULTISPECIES: competence type IV pilus major pilin ComGC [Alteribacter]|uniref:ComG operon protein 3 n=1 Tax=Alteribacter keqinensis TaxID=2483800 RepID=A0A3M7TTV0_9BACI|nr:MULTISPECIES: competence type IV pilus major pilin ComGC [Alteribacter]MBM7097319.1 prepilin-type N-terminal cleavage/methylation domain-containing protein [Alteribacter salitolerans]RNA68947.1 prepilin-type N-terminal cleavage/methylation domain-containing protein [Alteribacter keqinensis]
MLMRQEGFTLIEMVIVLMIISILLLIAVPGLGKNTEVANDKGCDATIEMLQAQALAYKAHHNKPVENLEKLKTEEYVTRITCPDNSELTIDNKGKVSKVGGE